MNATISHPGHSTSRALLVIAVVSLAGLALITMLDRLPRVEAPLSAHAVAQHGDDAATAKKCTDGERLLAGRSLGHRDPDRELAGDHGLRDDEVEERRADAPLHEKARLRGTMTTFALAKMTGVSINLKTGEITLTTKIKLNDENFRKAEQLKPYLAAKHGELTLEITSSQMSLPEGTASAAGKDGKR